MSSFEGENMPSQNYVFRCRIDFYFHDDKPAIETDENGNSDRNIEYKVKREKALKQ